MNENIEEIKPTTSELASAPHPKELEPFIPFISRVFNDYDDSSIDYKLVNGVMLHSYGDNMELEITVNDDYYIVNGDYGHTQEECDYIETTNVINNRDINLDLVLEGV